jgi:hypothetical protein
MHTTGMPRRLNPWNKTVAMRPVWIGDALIPRTFDMLLSAPAFTRARLAQLRICSGRFG